MSLKWRPVKITRPTTTNDTGKKTKTRSFLPLSPIIYSYRNICLQLLNFFQGDAGDSLTYHNGMMFSTKDRDNDKNNGWPNCAKQWKGAWWFNSCHYSNLNGQYLKEDARSWSGISWYYFTNDERSFKNTEMKIRPTQF